MSELPIIDPPRWSVRTRYHAQSAEEKRRKEEPAIRDFQLLYGTSVEMTRRGIDGERSLRAMSDFLNRKRLSPRERIECAADAPNPEKYLQKITP